MQAIASITDEKGQIKIPEWRPERPSISMRNLLKNCPVDPECDENWGEQGLTPAERMYAWNSFAVLAMKSGDPDAPVNAIAGTAWARCQLRFTAETKAKTILPALRNYFDKHGFEDVEISLPRSTLWQGTRTNPNNAWVQKTIKSIQATHGKPPVLIPCIGGTLPNFAFSDLIGMPTIWIPHSYAGCSQHAPDEHMLKSLSHAALQLMTGLFWDFGSGST